MNDDDKNELIAETMKAIKSSANITNATVAAAVLAHLALEEADLTDSLGYKFLHSIIGPQEPKR